MIRENGNKIFAGLFGGAMLVLALFMFMGCGEDPVCTDTGTDTFVTTETTETTETSETGDTGTTETGDTGMTATE